MPELEIHIDEERIIVNAPGTRLTITYQVSPDAQSLIENPFWTGQDRSASISLNEFRRSTYRAAINKAHELGWIRFHTSSSDQNGAAASAKLLSLG
jgi:hypothetical protein